MDEVVFEEMANETGRLRVLKTYKLFIGGKFPRTESGRYLVATTINGKSSPKPLANYCQASRKDLRDAVRAARAAQNAWAESSAYLRSQILYRMAEMLESRNEALVEELRSAGISTDKAKREVSASVDRMVYYAGWADKVQPVFGSVNPVASPHWNVTSLEPTGVIGLICPDEPGLLALVTLIAATIVTGNSVVAIPSETIPLPSISLSEAIATSDLPGGVVNVLTGKRQELVPTLASHMDVDGIIDSSADREIQQSVREGSGINVKRVSCWKLTSADWFKAAAEDPYLCLKATEFKTAWHPAAY